jgi:hypothetical protein
MVTTLTTAKLQNVFVITTLKTSFYSLKVVPSSSDIFVSIYRIISAYVRSAQKC